MATKPTKAPTPAKVTDPVKMSSRDDGMEMMKKGMQKSDHSSHSFPVPTTPPAPITKAKKAVLEDDDEPDNGAF
jgi:hypothetical protein